MNMLFDLSIIIVSYNTKDLLERCLRSINSSLNNSPLKCEVIVVDNHSTDGSWELIKSRFRFVTLVENQKNLGFGKANNQGVAVSHADTILFLNSDTEVIDSGLDKLYRFFTTLKNESIVGGKLINPDKTPQPSCGPSYTLPMIFTALFLKGDYRNITRYSPLVMKEVDWVMGACMMLKKSMFVRLSGFDEGIFMYMEEIDFEYRAQKIGVKIYFYPDARFFHKGAASSNGRQEPILNVFRGFLYFYKKHFSWSKLLFLRCLLAGKAILAMALFTVIGKFRDTALYMRALKIALT